jgi:hypothetical protein
MNNQKEYILWGGVIYSGMYVTLVPSSVNGEYKLPLWMGFSTNQGIYSQIIDRRTDATSASKPPESILR